MPKLDPEIRTKLEEPITLTEIEHAMDELSPGKTPGPDGIEACFYKTFISRSYFIVLLHKGTKGNDCHHPYVNHTWC